MGAKPLRFRFDKVDGFIKIYDGTRYLVLFSLERFNAIYGRISYCISEKSDTKYSINHNFSRIRIDSYHSLPRETTLPFHNVIILIKSIHNNNKNHCYYNIFLENVSTSFL